MATSRALKVTDKTKVKDLKTRLEKAGLLSLDRKISKLPVSESTSSDVVYNFYLPVTTDILPNEILQYGTLVDDPSIALDQTIGSGQGIGRDASTTYPQGGEVKTTSTDLRTMIREILDPLFDHCKQSQQHQDSQVTTTAIAEALEESGVNIETLLHEAPTRYLVYPPLLLFSPGAFTGSPSWTAFLGLNCDTASSEHANTENTNPYSSKSNPLAQFFFEKLLARLAPKPVSVHSNTSTQQTLTHVAENAPIPDKLDILRLPSRLIPLYPFDKAAFGDSSGNDSDAPTSNDKDTGFWCTTTQNGIKQTWAPMHTMFSRGNIKEKARVLAFAKANDNGNGTLNPIATAVDLYAGIGYFTFSYAASKRFKSVLCWELNPWSIRGLVKGTKLNKWDVLEVTTTTSVLEKPSGPNETQTVGSNDWASKVQYHDGSAMPTTLSSTPPCVVVFNEDNVNALERIKQATLCQQASTSSSTTTKLRPYITHINMGLLPNAHLAFSTAIEISLYSAAPAVYLHIHENVAVDGFDSWISTTTSVLQSLVDGSSDIPTANVTFKHLEKIKTYAPGVWHICGDFVVITESK